MGGAGLPLCISDPLGTESGGVIPFLEEGQLLLAHLKPRSTETACTVQCLKRAVVSHSAQETGAHTAGASPSWDRGPAHPYSGPDSEPQFA